MKNRVLFLKYLMWALCLPLTLTASGQFQNQTVARAGGAAVPEPCGFDALHQQMMQTDLGYRQRNELVDDIARNAGPFVRSLATYKIPVVVHVLEAGNGLTAITDAQIREAIQAMNERFRKVTGTLGAGSGVDVGIEFVLAVRDPNGNCTNGITRRDMTGNATYMASGAFRGSAGISETTLKAIDVWDQTRYYNIWAVSEIDNNDGGAGTQGFAYFSGAHGMAIDGMVLLVQALRDPTNTTLTHEMGHAMNVYHTFEGEAGAICPPNANCATQGDLVCDTPPHLHSNGDCNTGGTNACDGGTSNLLFVRNYMDYSSSACQNMFTSGQASRMVAALTTLRLSFLAANGNLALVPPGTPTLDLHASRNVLCGTGQSVTLYDRSTCIPNTYLPDSEFPSQSFSWTFTNGVNTYTSTLQNPTFIPASVGSYNATLTITTSLGTFSRTENGIVLVTASGPVAACTPTSFNGSGNFQFTVSRVRFNTLDNATNQIVNNIYQDFTCSKNTVVVRGGTYPLSIIFNGQVTNGPEVFQAYIDYNNNGVFENPSELIASGSTTAGGAVVNANVTIPMTAVQNTLLRMRVYGEVGTLSAAELTCTQQLVADVEDYGVHVASANLSAVSIAAAPGTTITYGTNVTFTPTPTNGGGAPTYGWYRNNAFVSTGATYASNTLLPGDQVRCEMFSTLAGVIGSPAQSNTLTMTVAGAPRSDFMADRTQVCTGGQVAFTDLSALVPTSWSWSFPGGTPSTSTAQNPTVTYNTPGVYNVVLTASNGLGTGTTMTKTAYIAVSATPATGCVVTRTNAPAGDIGIRQVKLNTINNVTPFDDAVMNNFACSKVTTLLPNTAYGIEVFVSLVNDQWVRVYIDYNNNGVFTDAGELVFAPANGKGLRTGTFTTPAAPTANVIRRMRVISDFVNTAPGPCTTPLDYGQVEDYGVMFASVDCQGVLNGPALPGTACNDANACTTGDTWNASCQCVGTVVPDTDSDGLCDAIDPCPTGPNPGTACNDNNACTTGDVISAGCVCVGTPAPDTDGDGLCDAQDNCPTVAGQIGSACNDGNPNTSNDVLNASCVCQGSTLPGDNVCSALPLIVGANGPFSNVGATVEAGEPTPPLGLCETQGAWCGGGGAANNSVWFTFTAPATGRISLNFGTTQNWDSQIALWSAASCAAITSGGATLLAANDDITNASPYHAAILPICVIAGTTYYVQVDGFGTTTNGAFQLVLVEEPSAVSVSVAAAAVVCSGTGTDVTFTGTAGATVSYAVNGGAPQSGVLTGGVLVVNTGALTSAAVYDVINVSLGTCVQEYPGPGNNAVTIGIEQPPAIAAVTATPAQVCTGGTTQLAVTLAYCTSGLYTDGCGFGDIITNVQFANLNRSSGCDQGATLGYSLQAAPQVNVVAGQTYAFSMTTGANYAQGGAAWVDWDQDGSFENNEQIVSGYTGAAGASYSNPAYTVPANAANGATRMRVRCIYETNPGGLPCSLADYGEVEDYIVNVTGGAAYTYAWTPAGSLVNATVASPATTALSANETFNVTVTNTSGCTASGSVGVTVNAPPVITGVTATPPVLCAGANSQLQVGVAGVSPICTAGQSLGSCAAGDEYITNVTFGSIVSNTGCSLPAGYEDLTNLTNTVAVGAVALPLSVTFGPFFTGDQLRAWFDWNQNGVFTDPGEEFSPGVLAGTVGAPLTANLSINVPANAVSGPTRMRVRLTYTGAIPSCGVVNFGETEDYTVIVTGGSAPITYAWSPSTFLSSATVSNPTAANVTATTAYTVTVTGGNGCPAQGNVSVSLDATDTDADAIVDCVDNCPTVPGQVGSPCNDGNANTINDALDGACQCVGTVAIVAVQAKVVLEGAYVPADGLMRDNLRTLPSFPLAQPYGGAPYFHAGTETVAPAVLAVTGPDAVVDWVLVEVRSAATPTTVLQTRAGLLQRDGDVVHTDGFTPLLFNQVNGFYHVAVRHRNHLSMMTSPAVTLSGAGSVVDFTVSSTTTYGTDARKSISGAFPVLAMWAGDVTINNQIKYTGAGNDRDPILTAIGGTSPTATISGYFGTDVNLDGVVKYTGGANDRDPILVNIGGSVPTNSRNGQMP